jgi:hypothetical protein
VDGDDAAPAALPETAKPVEPVEAAR